ncbi:MAG: TRAP transporter substrate-binding protein [Rhodobacteraceae bacterium]|nr:TRAP transporter substrate-binding protein [Paracoccaceae bacterium]
MRRFLATLSVAATVGLMADAATAQEVTLTLQHFQGPKAPSHTKMLAPWAADIEKASGGRIKVELFPAMALGGKPPELMKQVRDGVIDLGWSLLGYTPGMFPRTEVFELPGVHLGSAKETTLAIAELYDLIKDDFKDVHPIIIHSHGGNAIHLTDVAVRTPADLEGLRIRTPSRTGGWVLQALGAEPVGMPLPELPQALSKGVVDGALVPFEVVRPLKLQDLTKYGVEGPEGQRFGTSIFMLAMNKQRYAELPDDLKKVIDDHSLSAVAEEIGQLWDDHEQEGKELRRQTGEIIVLSQEQLDAFDAKMSSVNDQWIDEATSKGLDGAGLYEAARAAVAAQHAR